MPTEITRRDFVKLGTLAAASAVLAGCQTPRRYVELESFVKPPEEELAGTATWYASTCRQCPAGCGIVVRTMNGRAKKIEGKYAEGEKVLVVDDVITDGGAKIEAIAPLEEAGLVVKDVVIILDREQGGAAILAAKGYKLHSLTTLSQALDSLVRQGKVSADMREKVRAFIAEHQFAKRS
jgi:orotate phosphoribosyltransferase